MTEGKTVGARNPLIAEAADLLRLMANPNRLAILCRLVDGEASVGEMEETLGIRQPTLSQQLGELRKAGLIGDRREAKLVFYRLKDERAQSIMDHIHSLFGAPGSCVAKPAPHPRADRKVKIQSLAHAAVFARILTHEERTPLPLTRSTAGHSDSYLQGG